MRKYRTIARIHLMHSLQYRANLLGGFAMYAMFLFVFFCLWRAIYATGAPEEYTIVQMIWYLCITELISFGTRTNAFSEIAQDVKNGQVAYQLARPYSYLGYRLSGALGGMALNFAAFGLFALLIGFCFVGPIEGFAPRTLPFGLLSLLLGILLNLLLSMCLGLTAFFLEENSGLRFIYSKLVFMLGTFLPLEFLPGWLAGIARCLPFSYVSWGPARLIVAFEWAEFARIVPLQIAWIALAAILARALYARGARRLETNGG